MTRLVSIQPDAVRMHVTFQRLAEEGFRGSPAARSTEIELDRVPLTIDRTIQIHQLPSNLNKGFVDTPTAADWPLEPSPTLLARLRVANDPAQNRRMRNRQTTLTKNTNQMAVTELEAKIPAEANKNDLVVDQSE